MESNQRKTISFEVPTKEEIMAKRPLIPASFGVAILMFLLPFCDIQCTNGQKIASMTGLQLVTGKTMNMQGGPQNKIPANIWAILALAAAVGGLGVYLKKHPKEALIGTAGGAIAFVSLIILKLTAGASAADIKDAPIEVDFKFAYWLALLAVGVGGAISFLRFRAEQDKTPEFGNESFVNEDDTIL